MCSKFNYRNKFHETDFSQKTLKFPLESKFIYNSIKNEATLIIEIKFMKRKRFSKKGSKTNENQNLQLIQFKMNQNQYSR